MKKEDQLTVSCIHQKENLYFIKVEDNRYKMLCVDGSSNKYTYKLSEFLSVVYGNWFDPLSDRQGKSLTFNLAWNNINKTKKAVKKPLLGFSTLNTRKNTKDKEESYYVLFDQGNYQEKFLSRLYDVNQILTYVMKHYDDSKIVESIDESESGDTSIDTETKKTNKKSIKNQKSDFIFRLLL